MATSERTKKVVLGAAAARVVLGLVAIPLAPLLYEDHFLVLVLLRPTKEVFLAGGYLVRNGDLRWVELFAAQIPLAVLGVWLFFLMGRLYAREISSGKMPPLAQRILKPDKVKKIQGILERRGAKLVFLGRLAVLSSATVAAAAGSSEMDERRFLPADGAGSIASFAEAAGAGYVLGEAYERSGPWLTVVGFVALAAFAILLGHYLKKS
ncbi:MAG: DedA family protein [Actinomycetota bacterium]